MDYHPYPKRDPIKNYFPVPNEIYHLGLESGEIAIYGYLLSIEDRKTYQCHPSYRTIGKAVRMSENTVKKYVAMLEDKALISTDFTFIISKSGRRMNGSLLYTIRPIQAAIDLYHERQLQHAELQTAQQRATERLAKSPYTEPPECPACGVKRRSGSQHYPGRLSRFRAVSEGRRGGAGESTGAFAAPVQPQPPAVRAVWETEDDAFSQADIFD